jgi:F-type H+-transporting ATPase subunit b
LVQIDFFTLSAQIINFLVLIFLLRRFLYKRIIKAMDEREKKISSKLKEAEDKKEEGQQEALSYQKKKQELLDRREELFTEAREEVEAWHKERTEKARIEVEGNKTRWYEAVERQKDLFLMDLRRRAGEQIYATVSRVLKDLANEDLERQIINTFIKRLQNLTDEDKEAITRLNQKEEHGIIIKSGFEIPEIMHEIVKGSVRDQVGDINIEFETEPDLLCGIELHARDWRITWSLAGYLDTLQDDISRAFEQMTAERK